MLNKRAAKAPGGDRFVDAQNAHRGADYGSALLCAFVPSAPL